MKQAVVLVGGMGTRLGAITRETPKPLLPIAGEIRFLDILIDNLARHGLTEICLVAGHLGEQVLERYQGATVRGARLVVVIEAEPAGTAGALLQLADRLDPCFLLSNGDSIFDINYLRLAAELGPRDVARLSLRKTPDAGRYGRVTLEGDRITGFHEKDPAWSGHALVSGGVYALRRSILDVIDTTPLSLETSVFPELCRQGVISGAEFQGYFLDIGLPETLNEARTSMMTHLRRPAVFFDHEVLAALVTAPRNSDFSDAPPPSAVSAIAACNDAGALALATWPPDAGDQGAAGRWRSAAAALQARLARSGAHIDQFYEAPFQASRRADHDLQGPRAQAALMRRAVLEWSLDRDRLTQVMAPPVRSDARLDEPPPVAAGDTLQSMAVSDDTIVADVKEWLQRHAEPAPTRSREILEDRARQARNWLFEHAFPLWWNKGFDRRSGCFHERLSLDGAPVDMPRRIRVQARQTFVYAMAGHLAWDGPWEEAVAAGAEVLLQKGLRADGGSTHLLDNNGAIVDPRRDLYDSAFVIFALAHAAKALGRNDLAKHGEALARWVKTQWSHPHGGYFEGELAAVPPRRQNPHMHMLEALLALHAVTGDHAHRDEAQQLLDLFESHFVDASSEALLEYFGDAWTRLPGREGATVEPGHEFEWAWLVDRAYKQGARDARGRARAIHVHAEVFGVDPNSGFVLDEISPHGAPLSPTSRLWPATERLKANVVWFERTQDPLSATAAVEAFDTIMRYCDTPTKGLWRDRRLADGSFVEEAAPASSFYHITLAFCELVRVVERT